MQDFMVRMGTTAHKMPHANIHFD